MQARAACRSFAAGLAAALLAASATACSGAGPDGAADEPERLSMRCDDDSGWECLAWAGGEDLRVALVSASLQAVTVQITRGELFVDATVLGPGGMEMLALPWRLEADPHGTQDDQARSADPTPADGYRLRSDGPIWVQESGAE